MGRLRLRTGISAACDFMVVFKLSARPGSVKHKTATVSKWRPVQGKGNKAMEQRKTFWPLALAMLMAMVTGVVLVWAQAAPAVRGAAAPTDQGAAAKPQEGRPAEVAQEPAKPAEQPAKPPEETSKESPNKETPAAKPQIKVVDQDKVRKALDKGIEYLKKQQRSNGEFVGLYHTGVPQAGIPGLHTGGYPVGETAIALLAMHFAGVDWNDGSFQKGLKYVLETDSKKTYCNSLLAQLLAAIPEGRRSTEAGVKMRLLADAFDKSQLPAGPWTYYAVTEAQMKSNVYLSGDNSNTQFAVLGLWQLALAGTKIPEKVWRNCEQHFLKTQGTSGGWTYWSPLALNFGSKEVISSSGATPTMTMTGLASLYIFLDQMHLQDEGKFNGSSAPRCGANSQFQQRIDKAMQLAETDMENWFRDKRMERSQAVRRGLTDVRVFNMVDLYYAYSIERVGEASGRKNFGAIDWYAEVGQVLLDEQNQDGSWGLMLRERDPKGLGRPDTSSPLVAETALAMLFLAKGRAPIFFNKLRYDGDWENDRCDVANLTRNAGHALEYKFNWQIVDIKSEPLEWSDSPVLFLNGHNAPRMSKQEKEKLKSFVANRGLIFAEACCGRSNFTTGVKSLGKELWPDLEWQKLPDDHPLYTQKTVYDLEKKPVLWALSDKTGFAFFLLSPGDLSCAWHQALIAERDMFRLGINVYKYAKRDEPIRPRPTR